MPGTGCSGSRMMTERLSGLSGVQLGAGLGVGLILGVLSLLGLWFTVRQVAATGRQGLLIVSFVVRAGLLLLGLYFLARVGIQALVAAPVGFLLARWFMTRSLGTGGDADDAVTG